MTLDTEKGRLLIGEEGILKGRLRSGRPSEDG
jgi:hypothetical protein